MARLSLTRKEDPRKRVTGTSYESHPAVEPPPSSYSEIGSQQVSRIVDNVPELRTRTIALRTYKKMVRSDSSVRASLRAGKAPVLVAEFYIEAFDQSEEAQIQREFTEYNLFQSPSVPFITSINDALRMLDFGFSIL